MDHKWPLFADTPLAQRIEGAEAHMLAAINSASGGEAFALPVGSGYAPARLGSRGMWSLTSSGIPDTAELALSTQLHEDARKWAASRQCAAAERFRHAAENRTMSLFDHVALVVSDYARSKAFYDRALAPLGVTVMDSGAKGCGYGRDQVDFWIGPGPTSFQTPEHLRVITPVHIAFAARSRREVDAFYKAAIEAGGTDFGPPGPRPQYHAGYYGAFVLDPDGHNIEAVFQGSV